MLRKYILTFINFSSQIYNYKMYSSFWPSTYKIFCGTNMYIFVKYIQTLLELKEIGVAVIDL